MVENLTADMGTGSLIKSKATFPVEIVPAFVRDQEGGFKEIPHRRGILRTDTQEVLDTVSNRYTLVPHSRIIESVESALEKLGLGDSPRKVHIFHGGAQMKALFKIEARQFEVSPGDSLCPMIRIGNSYDATQRVLMELGAFRRVCTNLSVGGGGVFSAGFRSIHAGEIDPNKTAENMGETLEAFPRMIEAFRRWKETPWSEELLNRAGEGLSDLPKRHRTVIGTRMLEVKSVWEAYNHGTDYATHETRSAQIAYRVLSTVNKTFSGLLEN